MRAFDDHGSTVDALLARWDELAPGELERLERDPLQAPRLDRLRRADGWLLQQLAGFETCPPAEQLYVYGRGPGYQTRLDPAQQAELDDHVTRCAECRRAVALLGVAPPSPLDLSSHEGGETPLPVPTPEVPSGSTPTPTPTPTTTTTLPRLRLLEPAPLAAAAALLFATGAIFWATQTRASFPETPVLRGVESGALLYPRGKVLAGGEAAQPTFSITPVADASRYRVLLNRHSGGAFEAGSLLETLEGNGAELRASAPLGPGHYTWEAWAIVNGLDRRLGARDFRVVADEPLRAKLARAKSLERVNALHSAGFFTDAREAARALPASAARDAYLGGLEQR